MWKSPVLLVGLAQSRRFADLIDKDPTSSLFAEGFIHREALFISLLVWSYMVIVRKLVPFICTRCLYGQLACPSFRPQNGRISKAFATSTALPQKNEHASANSEDHTKTDVEVTENGGEPGGMSRRLAQMTDETIGQGGRSAKKALEEGGFSEELKRRLEERIQGSSFKSENAAAFAQVNMPVRSKPCTMAITD